MPNFVISYHGGEKPKTPEEGKEGMEKFMSWLSDLGEAVVNPGSPLGKSMIVSSSDVSEYTGDNPWSGFSIVSAENMEAALEIAKKCPFLETKGTLEVAQVMRMNP